MYVKSWVKLCIRILILTIIIFLILFIIEHILILKQKIKNKDSSWDWNQENNLINKMIVDKYPQEYDNLFPLAMNKDDQIPKKHENEKRILVVGDSFVFGYSSTNINDTWWKQLNYKFKQDGYNDINVYGAGRYSLNTEDELNKILNNKKIMDAISPDLVIIGYVYNDPEEHDASGKNIIKDSWEPPDTMFYHLFPNTNNEIKARIDDITDNYNVLKFLGKRFGYRYDVRARLITEGESGKYYNGVLKKVDEKMKQLNIPYFFYFTQNMDQEHIQKGTKNVYEMMIKQSIPAYYKPINFFEVYPRISFNSNGPSVFINPVDTHPSIILTNYYAKEVYDILKKDYSYMFDNKKQVELELDINDTMPHLEINKINSYTYELEYPKNEIIRTIDSNFLYYPIKQNYIKLNLKYPKKITRIKISGENLKKSDLYINTIDEELGYDINEASQILTKCELISDDTFEINKIVSAINISASFKSEENRKIKIELIEG